MKSFINYYLIPPVIFLLLTLTQLSEPTLRESLIAVVGGLSVGLFAGFVLHMATLIAKKIRQ